MSSRIIIALLASLGLLLANSVGASAEVKKGGTIKSGPYQPICKGKDDPKCGGDIVLRPHIPKPPPMPAPKQASKGKDDGIIKTGPYKPICKGKDDPKCGGDIVLRPHIPKPPPKPSPKKTSSNSGNSKTQPPILEVKWPILESPKKAQRAKSGSCIACRPKPPLPFPKPQPQPDPWPPKPFPKPDTKPLPMAKKADRSVQREHRAPRFRR